jgi:hypothetical protein
MLGPYHDLGYVHAMTPARSVLSLLLALSAPLPLAACGGTVVFEEDGGGGDGGDGGANPAVTSVSVGPTVGSTANAGGGVSTSVGPTTVSSGEGGGPSAVTTVSSGEGGGVPAGCADHNIYAECLAFGECVPIFDDRCCSSCFPGECADCIDYQFVGCTERLPPEPGGRCGVAPCGFIPDWACEGGSPACDGGCFAQAGCVNKQKCSGDVCEISCDAVSPDACGPVDCFSPPPRCFDGEVPEASEGCWSGACIPAWVCSLQSPL